MKVPMADLVTQHQALKTEIVDALSAVVDNCRFILGDNVKALEGEIADYCGSKYGMGVNSGTDALILALRAIGVGEGDEVITTPFTFVATTEAIALVGAKPVYADIDPSTFNLDPAKIEEKITSKTKAILPVHLYGQAADVQQIGDIAARHGLKVIYDGAQVIGGEAHGKPIGAYGDLTTLSFFPTKNLGGAGDGGMVLTNNSEIADKLKYLRFHGSAGSYAYKYVGYCSRLDEMQAAVLRVKFPKLNEWTDLRRRNAAEYLSQLSDLDIELPKSESYNKHVYHQFTIRSTERDRLKEYLKSNEVDTGIYYPGPLHLEEAYSHLGYSPGDMPEAERTCKECLSLPVFPEMNEKQLAYVIKTIRTFFE